VRSFCWFGGPTLEPFNSATQPRPYTNAYRRTHRNFFGFAKQNAACLRRQEKCYMDFAAGECPAFGNATFRGSIPPSPKEKAPNGAFFFWWSRKVGKVSENVPLWWRA